MCKINKTPAYRQILNVCFLWLIRQKIMVLPHQLGVCLNTIVSHATTELDVWLSQRPCLHRFRVFVMVLASRRVIPDSSLISERSGRLIRFSASSSSSAAAATRTSLRRLASRLRFPPCGQKHHFEFFFSHHHWLLSQRYITGCRFEFFKQNHLAETIIWNNQVFIRCGELRREVLFAVSKLWLKAQKTTVEKILPHNEMLNPSKTIWTSLVQSWLKIYTQPNLSSSFRSNFMGGFLCLCHCKLIKLPQWSDINSTFRVPVEFAHFRWRVQSSRREVQSTWPSAANDLKALEPQRSNREPPNAPSHQKLDDNAQIDPRTL